MVWMVVFCQLLISKPRGQSNFDFNYIQGQQKELKHFGKESAIVCIVKICK